MRLGEFVAAIAQLRRSRGRLDAQLHADRVSEALGEPWVDAVLAADAIGVLEQLGFPARVAWHPAPLRIGETWLLLYEPRLRSAGTVARLRVQSADATRGEVFGADAQRAIGEAHAALLATTASECRELPASVRPEHFALPIHPSTISISGGSLGLSVAVVLASAAIKRPPLDTVAGSAQLDANGTLVPVAHLREKLAALRERWPHVSEFVVAADQVLDADDAKGLTVWRCKTLLEALPHFGLELARLPPSDLDRHLRRLHGFDDENRRPHSREEWTRLAQQAWETAFALAADDTTLDGFARSATWSALFHVHAGDVAMALRAVAELRRLPAAGLPSELRAWQRVIEASAQIDADPHAAVAMARGALDAACTCLPPSPLVQGQALGTLGRALMHDGQLAEAEPVLREAVDYHAKHLPHEEARSRVYLATCVRKAGRAAEALAIVQRGIELVDRVYPKRAVSRTTRLYLALEEGRCALDRGKPDEALEHFERVSTQQDTDSDYPRLGAVRGLAAATRALGWDNRADEALARCLAVARDERVPATLRQVAVMAVGDTLLASTAGAEPTERVADGDWQAIFPDDRTLAAVRARLERWIY